MSVGTVTRNVLRQGLTYGTFWPGALAQQYTSERRTENLLYSNTFYLLYGTNHKSYIPKEKNKRAKNLLYDTVGHIGHNPPTKLTNACFTTYDVILGVTGHQ
jgi:hypothetical protein